MLRMRRMMKDSLVWVSPRQDFWTAQENAMNQQRRMPFTYAKHLYRYREKAAQRVIAFTKHFNPLWDNLSMYVPKSLKGIYWSELMAFWAGVLVIGFIHAWEHQLWKERKWDKEPGCPIP